MFINAQLKPDTTRKLNYLIIPVLFKTPETGWAYGLSASLSFKTSFKNDTLTRTSVIQTLGIFSQRNQNVQGLDATIYFPKEKYILYAQVSHSYFPDKFWGIGQTTLNTSEEKYAFEQVFISPHLKRKIKKNVFVGVIVDYQNLFKVRYEPNGVFDTTNFYGKNKHQVSGVGMSLSYDSRNAAFWPTKGLFFQTQYTVFDKNIASSYAFTKWMIELRYFKKLFKNHVIATQLYSYTTVGNAPIRSLAAFGGAGNLRGFYQGRYRDNSMYSVIAEYRAYLFWRLSACAFAGIGDVYHNPSQISMSTLKYSFGGGIRLAILEKEKLNLRIDYGYSDDYNKGLYFTIGECF